MKNELLVGGGAMKIVLQNQNFLSVFRFGWKFVAKEFNLIFIMKNSKLMCISKDDDDKFTFKIIYEINTVVIVICLNLFSFLFEF